MGFGAGSFVLIILLLLSSYAEWFVGWTGLSTREVRDSGGELVAYYPAKTFWDWLELLLVPAVLAIGGFLFTRTENRQTRDIEERRLVENRRIEEERIKEARTIEHERTQDAIIKDYFDQMTELLLHHQLRESSESTEVRSVARARTLTALRGVNGERKGMIIQFLYESKLIGYFDGENTRAAVVHLREADFSKVDFVDMNFRGVDLSRANFTGADFSKANLIGVDFSKANLRDTDFSGANPRNANLGEANLAGAKFGEVRLDGQNLLGIDILSTSRGADLQDANLSGTNLTGAKFGGASIDGTKFGGAKLRGTDLCNANLNQANLSAAERLTTEQLLEAESLHGTILPDYIDPADLGDKWSPSEKKTTPNSHNPIQ